MQRKFFHIVYALGSMEFWAFFQQKLVAKIVFAQY